MWRFVFENEAKNFVLFVPRMLSHHHQAAFAVCPHHHTFLSVVFILYVCIEPALNSIIWVHYDQLFFIVGKSWDMHVSSVISTHIKLLWINTCKLMWSSHKLEFSLSLSFLSSFITWNHFSYHLELVVNGWKNKK